MKKIRLKIIIIGTLFILITFTFSMYKNYNLVFVDNETKNKLMIALKIQDSKSFKPLYIKRNSFDGNYGKYYEIKFEISIQEYEANRLDYSEEIYYNMFIECKYKEKKNDNTYICIIRISEIYNKTLYQEIEILI